MSTVVKDLGAVSAYAYAVEKGYTGTEAEFAELMASYATVGQTAVTAAQTATTKASEAATSATTATNKASEATTAAQTATNKAAEAQADADAAALDASQALSAASTATTKATEATTAAATATSAKTDAVAANTAAQSAKTAAQTAQTGAETAAASVQSSAAQIQTNADDISELKEDLTLEKNNLFATKNFDTYDFLADAEFEKGSISSGTDYDSSTRIRSGFLSLDGVRTLNVSVETGYKYVLVFYTDLNTFVTEYNAGTYYVALTFWNTTTRSVFVTPKVKYVRVLVADTSDSASITAADASKVTVLADYPLIYNNDKNERGISSILASLKGETYPVTLPKWDGGVPDFAESGMITKNATRIWSGLLDYDPNILIRIVAASGYKCAYYIYDESFDIVSYAFWETSYNVERIANGKYIVIALSNSGDTSISASEGASNVTVYYSNATIQATDIISDGIIDIEWEIGTLAPGIGDESASTQRLRSGYIYVGEGTVLEASGHSHLIYTYDKYKTYEADTPWTTNSIVVDHECYIRVLLAKSDNATITSDDINDLVSAETIKRTPTIYTPYILLSDIPSYFDSQVDTAITKIQSNITETGINGDAFAFITDLHWQSNAKNSPILMQKVVENTDVGKVICGGDLIGGGTKATQMPLMRSCVESFKDIQRFYVLFGNHDTNTIGTSSADYFTKSEVYAVNQKHTDFVMEYGAPCYFYFDNPTTKTRYICLDTGLETTTTDATQIAWINATLASMPTGYHVLVFAHIVYQTTTTWHVGLQPSELQITSFMSSVCNILDTFNTNNSDKKVEAIFGGHTHIDCNFSTAGGIPIVLTDCDARLTFTETSTGSGTANHALGTVNEQCFDVVTIDYSEKTIKCVRIGRGSDRTITY